MECRFFRRLLYDNVREQSTIPAVPCCKKPPVLPRHVDTRQVYTRRGRSSARSYARRSHSAYGDGVFRLPREARCRRVYPVGEQAACREIRDKRQVTDARYRQWGCCRLKRQRYFLTAAYGNENTFVGYRYEKSGTFAVHVVDRCNCRNGFLRNRTGPAV
jgi:hypothetical protein